MKKKKEKRQISIDFTEGTNSQKEGLKKHKPVYAEKILDQFKRLSKKKWASELTQMLIYLNDWESTYCRLVWRLKSSSSNRLFIHLVVLNANKNGVENNLLLTPNTVQIAETPDKFQERHRERTRKGLNKAPHPNNKYNCLVSQILYSDAVEKLLPTPRASESVERRNWKTIVDKVENGGDVTLTTLVKYNHRQGLLPTPNTSDCNTPLSEESKQKFLENRKNKNLTAVPSSLNQLRQMAYEGMLPTPNARDYKGGNSIEHLTRVELNEKGKIKDNHINQLPNFIKTQTGESSHLNPLFVTEMMGFPPDWLIQPFLTIQNKEQA